MNFLFNMSVSKKITKENLIEVLKKHENFSSLNFSNTEYTNFLLSKIEDGKTYSLGNIESIYMEVIEYKNKNSISSFKYWSLRGYSYDEFKNIIRKRCKKNKVFFSIDEFQKFLYENPDNNLWDLNLENYEFVKDLLSKIEFDEYFTLEDFYRNTILKYCIPKDDIRKNKGFVKTKKWYYTLRGFSEEEAESIIKGNQRKNSNRCKEYYMSRGLSEEEAIIEVSKVQKQYNKKSRHSKYYWMKLGYSEEEAKEKASLFSKEHSVWWKNYWINLGYSEEEAKEKVLNYNPASKSFMHYKNNPSGFYDFCRNVSIKQKNNWDKGLYSDKSKLKEGLVSRSSKVEIKCFEFLQEKISKDIKHEPYIVIFPEYFISKNGNSYFYACDGYLETDLGIIIFEYDGGIGVFHQPEKDEIRDTEIMMLDENIIGVIRILESFFKNSNIISIDNQINQINDAIEKIKSNKERRIRLS